MLRNDANETLSRVGKGTPDGGELFRRFWLPAVLTSEVAEPDCDPVRLRILGEDLVAFRDTLGRVGIVAAHCAHRLAPLYFGRNEDCGLRCLYHGWKFDVEGNCVETPNVPADAPPDIRSRVGITAYPVEEHSGGGLGLHGSGRGQAALPGPRVRPSARGGITTPRAGSSGPTGPRAWRARSTPRTSPGCTATSTRNPPSRSRPARR